MLRCFDSFITNNLYYVKYSAYNSSSFYALNTLSLKLFEPEKHEIHSKVTGYPVCKVEQEQENYLTALIIVMCLFLTVTLLTLTILYKQKVLSFTKFCQN